jgi:hypothetical protein
LRARLSSASTVAIATINCSIGILFIVTSLS